MRRSAQRSTRAFAKLVLVVAERADAQLQVLEERGRDGRAAEAEQRLPLLRLRAKELVKQRRVRLHLRVNLAQSAP